MSKFLVPKKIEKEESQEKDQGNAKASGAELATRERNDDTPHSLNHDGESGVMLQNSSSRSKRAGGNANASDKLSPTITMSDKKNGSAADPNVKAATTFEKKSDKKSESLEKPINRTGLRGLNVSSEPTAAKGKKHSEKENSSNPELIGSRKDSDIKPQKSDKSKLDSIYDSDLFDKLTKYIDSQLFQIKHQLREELSEDQSKMVRIDADAATELIVERVINFTKEMKNADAQYIYTALTNWDNNYNYLRKKLKSLIQILIKMGNLRL